MAERHMVQFRHYQLPICCTQKGVCVLHILYTICMKGRYSDHACKHILSKMGELVSVCAWHCCMLSLVLFFIASSQLDKTLVGRGCYMELEVKQKNRMI